MNRLMTLFSILLVLFVVQIQAQQTFNRTTIINSIQYEGNGFGGIVAGVDFDNDGNKEFYLCNTNTVDSPPEVLIPRIYKFEWNGTSWDSVWAAVTDIPLQNTWPGLTTGDLDGDGRPELIWTPINNLDLTTNPNPKRILVYEYPGDGSDDMGVSDGFGGFLPNASTTIVSQDNFELRPCRVITSDVDNDGKQEVIFCDRRAGAPPSGGFADYHVGIFSVSDIPDLGGGTETWTEEFTGLQDLNFTGTGNKWDINVLGNYVYVWGSDANASIFTVKFNGTNYESLAPIPGVAAGNSFKGSQVVDLDGNSVKEIIYGAWFAPAKVYLVQPNGDNLTSIEIADFTPLKAARIVGSGQGDLDSDGKLDIVFGTRWVDATTANSLVLRLEYQGGDITNPANYVTSVIDSGSVPGAEMDVIGVANLDGDTDDEIIVTAGYPRGPAPDVIDVFYLDWNFTAIERENNQIPDAFYVQQNYPNPFNPTTNIKFGIKEVSNVDLRIYDILGNEVAVLIDNRVMNAGSYNVTFEARNLASGTYIYTIRSGENVVSKKMQLIK